MLGQRRLRSADSKAEVSGRMEQLGKNTVAYPTLEWMIWHMMTEPSLVVAYHVWTERRRMLVVGSFGQERARGTDLSLGVDASAAVPLEVLYFEGPKEGVRVGEGGLDGVDVGSGRSRRAEPRHGGLRFEGQESGRMLSRRS